MRSVPKLIAGCLLLAASECPAQTSPTEVARRELLQGADAARAAGDHPRALDLARRAGEIRMTPSVRLLLAQESEVTGSLLEALDHASGCVREAEADATLRNRATILTNCRALESALRPRLGSVVLQVGTPPAGAVIRVAGHEIPAALFGLPVRVMPGSVVVEVGGEGIEASHQEVQVAAGTSVDVPVQVRAVESAAIATVADTRLSLATQTVTPAQNGGPGAGPWVLVGTGGAAVIAGGILLAMGASELRLRDGLNCQYRDSPCAPEYNDHDNNQFQYTNWGTGVAAAGATAMAAGVLWWLIARSTGDSQARSSTVSSTHYALGAFNSGLRITW